MCGGIGGAERVGGGRAKSQKKVNGIRKAHTYYVTYYVYRTYKNMFGCSAMLCPFVQPAQEHLKPAIRREVPGLRCS